MRAQDAGLHWRGLARFQISKGADGFKLCTRVSEGWIERREEASRAKLEGSRDYGDLYL